MRLQKILADRGVASRRKAEEIIEEGRVTVKARRQAPEPAGRSQEIPGAP
ncbi:MAG: S4 domain-containing protein [Nitrospirota bacterium]